MKIKKFIFALLIILMGILINPTESVANNTNVTFFIGDNKYYTSEKSFIMDVSPFIENGRVYLPVRYLANAIGINQDGIIWIENNNQIILKNNNFLLAEKGHSGIIGDKKLTLTIGSKLLYVNSYYGPYNYSPITMDVEPIIKHGRVFLPARYIAEAFGKNVYWDSSINAIQIELNEQKTPSILPININPTEDNTPISPYTWQYKDSIWTWAPNIPQWTLSPILEHYRDMPHPHRTQLDYVLTYCTDKDSLIVISNLAETLAKGAIKEGLKKDEIPDLAIAFVQSFEYVSDSISSGYDEYPRYPLETLIERRGDCEDTAILIATILKALNYDTALIFFDDHCAVGIWGSNDLEGYYYLVNNKRYYYLETTDIGWKVGQVPKDLQGKKAVVIPLP